MVRCAAFGCGNSSNGMVPGITFYRFPKNEKRRKIWIDALKRKNWEPTKHSRICSVHFEDRYKITTAKRYNWLSSDAVPTIFPTNALKEEPPESCASPTQDDPTLDAETKPQSIQVVQVSYKRVPREMTALERRIEKMTQRCAEQRKKIKLLQLQNRRSEQDIINVKRVISKLQRKRAIKDEDTDEQLQLLVVYD